MNDSEGCKKQLNVNLLDSDFNLYEIKVEGERYYFSCPKCNTDMSYFASPTKIMLICNNCDNCLVDDEANKYAMSLLGGKFIRINKTQFDGYHIMSDLYPVW